MAIDDVVSDYETSVANNAKVTIQPASGDEWLVTQLLVEGPSEALWTLESHTQTNDYESGLYGGDTSYNTSLGIVGVRTYKLLMTNSEYVRMHNQTGATRYAGFSAIKTKD